MKRALVISASGGIGRAVSTALVARGVSVTALSRSGDGLDLTDGASVARILGALDGPFDLIFVASGALGEPEKSLKDLDADAMAAQFAINTIGPALVLQHAPRLLPRKGRSVFAALSARVGSIGDNRLGGWYSYRASKAALNQVLRCGAIEIARSHREAIITALHPGTVATSFTADYRGRHPAVPSETSAENLLRVIDGLTPDDSGNFYDWQGERIAW
ncbi:SDR family NAD(P)-dependent oxidoreductase [Roseovarius sp. LXJ103]|uniref:SDR family NAD(P)-dependent oxidoreductase n=1 Tax=Roseovarius carneus TaxID=2853164 RepID=UPI000D6107DF|nr:SDR family NAD(P)-dependent oxidoreductase [Roseovarius carneus]MBZ8117647.1 SDR family NAD(P)-dependent oxidoreductase [Roseovarius carneus]PWE36570.1 C factor, cell signaling protein [Pelagicola sp. LXJ1103]